MPQNTYEVLGKGRPPRRRLGHQRRRNVVLTLVSERRVQHRPGALTMWLARTHGGKPEAIKQLLQH